MIDCYLSGRHEALGGDNGGHEQGSRRSDQATSRSHKISRKVTTQGTGDLCCFVQMLVYGPDRGGGKGKDESE
ncbi:hypothetical protein E2C01_100944 [Portunus trituberculatus]|uniref:Uncharacterized protein n=1 Tax=Portunus trituberculatus TaxID=210409 RepID=A0A5B7K9C1_PORTR|nr:hypothetical protein [Portunus trituberculatus]